MCKLWFKQAQIWLVVEEHRRRRTQNLEEGELSQDVCNLILPWDLQARFCTGPAPLGPWVHSPACPRSPIRVAVSLAVSLARLAVGLPVGFDQAALAEIGEWEEGSNQDISPHPHLSPNVFLVFAVSLPCPLLPAIQACPGFSSQDSHFFLPPQ